MSLERLQSICPECIHYKNGCDDGCVAYPSDCNDYDDGNGEEEEEEDFF